jgi:hypothetical protein
MLGLYGVHIRKISGDTLSCQRVFSGAYEDYMGVVSGAYGRCTGGCIGVFSGAYGDCMGVFSEHFPGAPQVLRESFCRMGGVFSSFVQIVQCTPL